ncbi:MAG: LPS export ABC transporter permease LptF [Steroidobacteraceae bacterium]
MGILQRYLWREMTQSFLGVTCVLFAILCVNQVGAVLARAAQQDYPRAVVWQLIALGAAENIAILLPIGLLLGIVLALGRFYHDNELVAAQACGLGQGRVLAAALWLALPVTALLALLTLQWAPAAASREGDLRASALRAAQRAPLEPGRFRSFNGGRTVVYAQSRADNGDLLDVFIKRTIGPQVPMETTVARRARLLLSSDGATQSVELFDGERYEGNPGEARFRILRFQTQSIPIAPPAETARRARPDELPTSALLGATSRAQRAELQWRVGMPIMALVLTALALPLARLRPRQGRYGRIWQAVLVFALYANLALAAKSWLERGVISERVGLWWVHGLFALVALWLVRGPVLLARWRAARAAAVTA